MAFQIIRNNLTKVHADAIVNTANPEVTIGAGLDTAIYEAAGREELLAARAKIGKLPAGAVGVTPAFGLPAQYIIHASGPWWEGGAEGEAAVLRDCYDKSLAEAFRLDCGSIAFPLLSTGTYGFPREEALRIAVDSFSRFLDNHDMEIFLVVFDDKSVSVSEKLFRGLQEYVDENYVAGVLEDEYAGALPVSLRHESFRMEAPCVARVNLQENSPRTSSDSISDHDPCVSSDNLSDASFRKFSDNLPDISPCLPSDILPDVSPCISRDNEPEVLPYTHKGTLQDAAPGIANINLPDAAPYVDDLYSIEEEDSLDLYEEEESEEESPAHDLSFYIEAAEDPFCQYLQQLINKKGYKNSQVYKKANLTKQYFSKLMNGQVNPSKEKLLSISIALELNMDEAKDMLRMAGYALSPCNKVDLVVEYFIRNGKYNMFDIEIALDDLGLPTLSTY